MVLTALIASAFVLGSPNSAVATDLALSVAPVSVVDGDSDKDRDRQRGQRGRRNRGSDSDSDRDSDRDSDNDSDRRDRRGDNCIDVNGDGRCDFGSSRRSDSRRSGGRRDGCIDNDRDGRCDFGTTRGGRALPDMISAIMISRGQRSPADQWLSPGIRNVRLLDQDRNRVPERATFFDGAGRVAQVWLDNNRDGRADRVQYYQNGRLVRVASR